MWPRSVSPPSSFVDLRGHGGITSSLCSWLTTWLGGESSRQHSEDITYQQVGVVMDRDPNSSSQNVKALNKL
jgi:hypothetical protein